MMLVSPWIGWNITAKWLAKPAPDVNRASGGSRPADVLKEFRKKEKIAQSQLTVEPRMEYSIRT